MIRLITQFFTRRRLRAKMAVYGYLVRSAELGHEKVYIVPMWQEIGFSASALYVALDELEKQGLVVGVFDFGPYPRRRAYLLTERREETR